MGARGCWAPQKYSNLLKILHFASVIIILSAPWLITLDAALSALYIFVRICWRITFSSYRHSIFYVRVCDIKLYSAKCKHFEMSKGWMYPESNCGKHSSVRKEFWNFYASSSSRTRNRMVAWCQRYSHLMWYINICCQRYRHLMWDSEI